jgi:hypothetical protein
MAAGFMPQMHILIFRFWLLASGYWLFAIDAQLAARSQLPKTPS